MKGNDTGVKFRTEEPIRQWKLMYRTEDGRGVWHKMDDGRDLWQISGALTPPQSEGGYRDLNALLKLKGLSLMPAKKRA